MDDVVGAPALLPLLSGDETFPWLLEEALPIPEAMSSEQLFAATSQAPLWILLFLFIGALVLFLWLSGYPVPWQQKNRLLAGRWHEKGRLRSLSNLQQPREEQHFYTEAVKLLVSKSREEQEEAISSTAAIQKLYQETALGGAMNHFLERANEVRFGHKNIDITVVQKDYQLVRKAFFLNLKKERP